ncbi:Hypothetical protein SMAX5B_016176, partial [Scophthalmus maximus]
SITWLWCVRGAFVVTTLSDRMSAQIPQTQRSVHSPRGVRLDRAALLGLVTLNWRICDQEVASLASRPPTGPI